MTGSHAATRARPACASQPRSTRTGSVVPGAATSTRPGLVPRLVEAGVVRTTWTSTVACPVTRSVRALARARSMRSQVPSVTYRWASSSMAAHARQASSEGNVPSQVSTPGSSTHRRRLDSDRARCARWRSRSGLIRASSRRARRRRRAESSTPNHPSSDATTVAATSGGHSSSSAATTCARYASSTPDAIAACNPPSPVHDSVPSGPSAAVRSACRTRRSAATAVRPSTPERTAGASSAPCPSGWCTSMRVPSSHHCGSTAASRTIAASCAAVASFTRDWSSPATAAHSSRDPRTPLGSATEDSALTCDTHRVQHVLRTDRGDHGLPLPSYPRCYRTRVRYPRSMGSQFRSGATPLSRCCLS